MLALYYAQTLVFYEFEFPLKQTITNTFKNLQFIIFCTFNKCSIQYEFQFKDETFEIMKNAPHGNPENISGSVSLAIFIQGDENPILKNLI